jgi:hypothetical protein
MDSGVDVVREDNVGVYNVKVIDAEEPGPMIDWLRENDFAFRDEDKGVFEDYIDRGWCFVVARVAMSHGGSGFEEPGVDPVQNAATPANTAWEEVSPDVVDYQGLAAPLILRFPTDDLVYPMALTSLAGSNTTVHLYTLTDHRVTCGPRLEQIAAWPVNRARLMREGLPLHTLDPPHFFSAAGAQKQGDQFLCRFEGILTPVEMQSDLYFEQAETDETFRKVVKRY